MSLGHFTATTQGNFFRRNSANSWHLAEYTIPPVHRMRISSTEWPSAQYVPSWSSHARHSPPAERPLDSGTMP
eukprot:4359010-Pleurochrysis_carterae.AAC.1